MKYEVNAVPERVIEMRNAWAHGDAVRDKDLTEPETIEKYRDISYVPYDEWNLLDLYIPKNEKCKAGEG